MASYTLEVIRAPDADSAIHGARSYSSTVNIPYTVNATEMALQNPPALSFIQAPNAYSAITRSRNQLVSFRRDI